MNTYQKILLALADVALDRRCDDIQAATEIEEICWPLEDSEYSPEYPDNPPDDPDAWGDPE